MKRSINSRAGLALFLTISTIAVVSIIVYGMMFFMRGEVHLTENYVDSVTALLMAESGIEECLFTIKSQMNDPKNPIYAMIAKSDDGTLDIDLSRLEGKVSGVAAVIPGAKVKARISWHRDPKISAELAAKGLPPDIAREGVLKIESRGSFHRTSRQVEITKQVKARLVQSPIPGHSVGMIAPEHGLYFNKSHVDSFKINSFDFWDPWGFKVVGGKVYMKDGVKVDLPKWLMLTKMRKELEHPWLDMGIGWTGWNGGADFSEVDSLEFTNRPISRSYHKWMGLFHWPWWEKSSDEYYSSRTKKVKEYNNKKINLYTPEVYRRLANRVVDPKTNPSQKKYFKNINFREAFGRNEQTYKNVVPLYGWGDWRNVPHSYHRLVGNPTRAHDTSHAVEINGLTFIKGDVFLEGWVKGKGLLVVEGNIYIGGDVLTMPGDNGAKSAVGFIALRDKDYDTGVENPKSGRIIYKPHHDSDWSRAGITHLTRDITPRLEGSFHAEGGLELDTDSKLKKLINMEIVGNFSTDYFDRRRMPNDVKIKYYNWQEVLSQSDYDYAVDHKVSWSTKYDVAVQKEITTWREVDATL